MSNFRRWPLVGAALAMMIGGTAWAAADLAEYTCRPLTAKQKSWVPDMWETFTPYVVVCDFRGVLQVLTVSASRYYKNHDVLVPLPPAYILSPEGAVLGVLPQAFPDDPPAELNVQFDNSRTGLPETITFHIKDESAAGNHTAPALHWNRLSGQYETTSPPPARFLVWDSLGKYGYIDETGRLAIPYQYDGGEPFSEGLARVWVATPILPHQKEDQEGKAGYIDVYGHWVIPPAFAYAGSFSEGLAVATHSGKYGYIDRRGKWVIPATYDFASDFHEGLGRVRLHCRVPGDDASPGCDEQFIDRQGRVVIPTIAGLFAENFSEGRAIARVPGQKVGYLDHTGRYAITPQFDEAGDFAEELAWFRAKGRYGYIDKDGREFIPPYYFRANGFSEGYAAVQIEGGKVGYIDHRGKMLIRAKFLEGQNFSQGLAAVRIKDSKGDSRWGYIDDRGRWVIPAQYTDAESFKNGLAGVEWEPKNGAAEYRYIDKTGRVIWKGTPEHEDDCAE